MQEASNLTETETVSIWMRAMTVNVRSTFALQRKYKEQVPNLLEGIWGMGEVLCLKGVLARCKAVLFKSLPQFTLPDTEAGLHGARPYIKTSVFILDTKNTHSRN